MPKTQKHLNATEDHKQTNYSKVNWIMNTIVISIIPIIIGYTLFTIWYINNYETCLGGRDASVLEEVNNVCVMKWRHAGLVIELSHQLEGRYASGGLINNIDTYLIKDMYIYISKNFESRGKVIKDDSNIRYSILSDKDTMKFIDYGEDIPPYAKLNTITTHIDWYKTLDEMPKEDREIFKELERELAEKKSAEEE